MSISVIDTKVKVTLNFSCVFLVIMLLCDHSSLTTCYRSTAVCHGSRIDHGRLKRFGMRAARGHNGQSHSRSAEWRSSLPSAQLNNELFRIDCFAFLSFWKFRYAIFAYNNLFDEKDEWENMGFDHHHSLKGRIFHIFSLNIENESNQLRNIITRWCSRAFVNIREVRKKSVSHKSNLIRAKHFSSCFTMTATI